MVTGGAWRLISSNARACTCACSCCGSTKDASRIMGSLGIPVGIAGAFIVVRKLVYSPTVARNSNSLRYCRCLVVILMPKWWRERSLFIGRRFWWKFLARSSQNAMTEVAGVSVAGLWQSVSFGVSGFSFMAFEGGWWRLLTAKMQEDLDTSVSQHHKGRGFEPVGSSRAGSRRNITRAAAIERRLVVVLAWESDLLYAVFGCLCHTHTH